MVPCCLLAQAAEMSLAYRLVAYKKNECILLCPLCPQAICIEWLIAHHDCTASHYFGSAVARKRPINSA